MSVTTGLSVPLGDCQEWLASLALLQLLIAFVAWAGMIFASCFDDFSFVPMDRHLNKGLRHFRASPAARRCFLHEFASHAVAQLCFADLLRRSSLKWSYAVQKALGILSLYALLVFTTAMIIPPHALPYNLGRVPKLLRCPLSLPPKLYGDGASERALSFLKTFWKAVESLLNPFNIY